MECGEDASIQVGNADLLQDGLYIGVTKLPVADWDEFGIVVKYCKKHIMKALDKAFRHDLGELYEVSAGHLALRNGLRPSEQFKAVAQSFRGDPLQTKILIGWCVLLHLEIRLNPDLSTLAQADIATNYIAHHAWRSAFTVPIPQTMRGALVDIPAGTQKKQWDLYEARRFDKAMAVTIPSAGSSTTFTPFGISTKTGGDILVTPGQVLVGLLSHHRLRSEADLSMWLANEPMHDFSAMVEEHPDFYRYRVHQQPGYTCLRLLCKIDKPSGEHG